MSCQKSSFGWPSFWRIRRLNHLQKCQLILRHKYCLSSAAIAVPLALPLRRPGVKKIISWSFIPGTPKILREVCGIQRFSLGILFSNTTSILLYALFWAVYDFCRKITFNCTLTYKGNFSIWLFLRKYADFIKIL
jgi:hypothetical protein